MSIDSLEGLPDEHVHVELTWAYPANTVHVYFHDTSRPPIELRMGRGSVLFKGAAYLPRGTHLYRYFVDGEWETDQHQTAVFYQGNHYHVIETNHDKNQMSFPMMLSPGSPPPHFGNQYVPPYDGYEMAPPPFFPSSHLSSPATSSPPSPTHSSMDIVPPYAMFPPLDIPSHAVSAPSSPSFGSGSRRLNGGRSPTNNYHRGSSKPKKKRNFHNKRNHSSTNSTVKVVPDLNAIREEVLKREAEWNAHVYEVKRQHHHEMEQMRTDHQKKMKNQARKLIQKKKKHGT